MGRSLRIRLWAVLALSAIVTLAAGSVVFSLLGSTDAARREMAEALSMAVLDEAAPRLRTTPRQEWRAILLESLRHHPRGVAGSCSADGGVDVVVRPSRHGMLSSDWLPPRARSEIGQLCGQALLRPMSADQSPVVAEIARDRDSLIVSVLPIRDGAAAYVLVPARRQPWPAWTAGVLLLSVSALALVIFVVDIMLSLARGLSSLRRGLRALQGNLAAEVPIPRAQELAELAAGLTEFARHLDRSRARELELERHLSHQQRLSALGRVVAGVAHEIRNPLAGIKLRLDLITRRHDLASAGLLGVELREDAQACLQEIARIDAVVAALLGFARRREGKPSAVSLGELVDGRIGQVRALSDAKGVQVERRGGDVVLQLDRDQMDAVVRALDNLLRNAVEASPREAAVEVVIHPPASSSAAEDSFVNIEVSDAGAGISKAHEEQLFEPFFTTKAEGTGLGLWISRSLVQTMGGTIAYERTATCPSVEHGDGAMRTRFVVRLPTNPKATVQGSGASAVETVSPNTTVERLTEERDGR